MHEEINRAEVGTYGRCPAFWICTFAAGMMCIVASSYGSFAFFQFLGCGMWYDIYGVGFDGEKTEIWYLPYNPSPSDRHVKKNISEYYVSQIKYGGASYEKIRQARLSFTFFIRFVLLYM